MKYMITGGYGFIGANFILKTLEDKNNVVLNIDKISYCSSPQIFKDFSNERLNTIKKDINAVNLNDIICDFKPDRIIHFAAESHVDRSIDSPKEFIDSNIIATYKLLEAIRFYSQLNKEFKYIHISTDEVYGSLGFEDEPFTENSCYDPSSPYSSSKASSDHLAMAWQKTYDLPILLTNCSNNFGPWQFPEKLIPLTIINIINKKPISIYGSGKNIRDWLYVEDHVDAINKVSEHGIIGEKYNIGGNNEKNNLEIVKTIIDIMGQIDKKYQGANDLIQMVSDRPAHDLRYAINPLKINSQLNWYPKKDFHDAILNTVEWYLKNTKWWENILETKYKGDRLGVLEK